MTASIRPAAFAQRPNHPLRNLGARNWFSTPVHEAARSLRLVRYVVAMILLIHPTWALVHPADLHGLGQLLASRGLPLGLGLAWTVTILQVGCSLALLVGRWIHVACLGHLFVLGAGIWMVHAPYWYVVGGAATDGHPGVEFSVLLMACLLGVGWARGRSAAHMDAFARQGLSVVRLAAAILLIAHPLHGFAHPGNIRGFGQAMEAIGFPFGLFLVWTTLLLQTASSMALVVRRFVVPACLGQIFVLCMGIWIAHAPKWFVVGPGENGMEYSVLLITCFYGVLLSHWPRLDAPAQVA